MSLLQKGVYNQMRKLKFRFWLKNKMQGILELKQGGILDMAWEWDKVDQFTGLLDKQGKEIFEGDIVIQPMPSNEIWRGKIVFEQGAFRINEPNKIFNKELIGGLAEVIGNVRKNPELLIQKGSHK